jgi:hypothetical protein
MATTTHRVFIAIAESRQERALKRQKKGKGHGAGHVSGVAD